MEPSGTTQVFIEDNSIKWEQVAQGVKRKVVAWDEQLMLVRVEFEKGAVGALHEHHHSQITHVESGSFEVRIGEENKILHAGDAYIVPPNSIHGCLCLEPGVLIDAFSPKRDEFVPES